MRRQDPQHMARWLAQREKQGWSWAELSRRCGHPTWKLLLKDVHRIHEFVDQGRTPVAYSIFLDEGGCFRHRPAHPGTEWQDWSCGGARPREASVLVGVHRKT